MGKATTENVNASEKVMQPQRLLQLQSSLLSSKPDLEEFNLRNFTSVSAYYRIADSSGTGKLIIELGCVDLKEAFVGDTADESSVYLYLRDGSSNKIEISGLSGQPVLQTEKLGAELTLNLSFKLTGKISGSKTGPGFITDAEDTEKLPGHADGKWLD